LNRSADGWMWGDAYGHLAEDAADAWHQQREVEQRRQLDEMQACYLAELHTRAWRQQREVEQRRQLDELQARYLEDMAKLRKLQALQAELDALEQDLPK